MPENKTRVSDAAVADFVGSLEPASRRTDASALDGLFRQATGCTPRMWGPSIIGYGRYRYQYESGHTGEICAAGFNPRGKAISIYGATGFDGCQATLARLGKHKTGKSCLYLNRLSDVDPAVLAELIEGSLAALRSKWTVTAE